MPRTDSQRALDTLVYALENFPDLVEGAHRIGYLRGQTHEGLLPLCEKTECVQTYKPRHEDLSAAGFKMVDALSADQDLVLVLPERQKEQVFSDLARALDALKVGGRVLVSLHNDWGARRFQDQLEAVTGNVEVVTKNHCRAFWAVKTDKLHEEAMNEWRAAASLRKVLDDRFWSRPGLFSWNRVDQGSELLMSEVRGKLRGKVADLGCGWGYLSCEVLASCHDVTALDGFDADMEAVEAARRNVGNVMVPFRPRMHWQDVTKGVGDRLYDVVVTNPPFHEGREPDPTLGTKFLAAAARALKPHGVLWLVANQFLPYEAPLGEVFDQAEMVANKFGFKVMRATLPRHDLFFRPGKRGYRRS